MLVDCGLFQGWGLRKRNLAAFPIHPSDIDAVVLTHGHLDHTGYLPKLCKSGFSGRVHCTSGTRDLLGVLLPDSGYLMEEAARRAERMGRDEELLYDRADAERCLTRISPHSYAETAEIVPGVSVSFSRAGHILGSSSVHLLDGETTITFSGDVGRPNDPIMKAPDELPDTDFLVLESTYGDRAHPSEDVDDMIAEIIAEIVEKRGVLVVPAFAVGRAQHLLHIIARLGERGRIPAVPVFLDSPMAINATGIFCRNRVDHGLSEAECHQMCGVATYSRTPRESRAIDRTPGPKVVVSASGMMSGGRILHHLRRFLPEPQNTVLVVGYQAKGTRGRALVDGVDSLKIHGSEVPVRARVVQAHGLSAHADYLEMTDWLRRSNVEPKRVFLTHGEPSAIASFREHLVGAFGWDVVAPEQGSSYSLGT